MKNLLPGEGTDEARERLRPICPVAVPFGHGWLARLGRASKTNFAAVDPREIPTDDGADSARGAGEPRTPRSDTNQQHRPQQTQPACHRPLLAYISPDL